MPDGGGRERRGRGHGDRGRPRPTPRDARRAAARGRRRLQPRRAGEPRRLDGRPAVRPRREHRAASSRFLELLRHDEPGRGRRLHVDPPALRQAAVPAGRRGAPGRAGRRQRHHEVRGRAAPPAVPRACTGSAATSVRLTNVYGPRQRLRDDFQGFLPIFVRRALADEAITVFGDGEQERDCLYVDDVVECLLRAALAPERRGRGVQRRQRRAPRRCARSPTRSSSAAGIGPGRVRAVAARPRRDRHRLVLRRLVEGEAHARLGAAHPVRRRHRADRRRSTGSTAIVVPVSDTRRLSRIPVVDLARRAAALEPELVDAVARVVRSGALPARPRDRGVRSRARRVHAVGAHAVAVASGTEALRLALVALGVGAGRRGRSCPRSPRCRPRLRCARPARSPVPVDVDADDGDDRRRRRGRGAVTERTRAVIPVHLYGRPAALPDLGVPVVEDAAQAHGALDPARPRRRGGVQLLPDEEPRRHRRRRRGRHRRRRRSPRPLRLLPDATVLADRTTSTRVVAGNSRLSEVEAAVLRVGLGAPGRAERAAGARSRRATATRRPSLRWQAPHERHVYHLCVARVDDRDALPGAAARSTPACTTRVRSRSSPRTAVHRGAVPGGRGVGGRVRIVAVLPRDDRRRDRGGVSSAPVNPAVEVGLGVLPLLQRRGHDRVDGASSRSATLDARRRRRRDHRHQRRLDRRLRRRARRSSPTAEPRLRVVTHERNRGYGGALLSGFAAATRSSGSSTPTATGSSIPPSSSCSSRARRRRRRRRAGLQAPTRRQPRYARVIGRVYHRFVVVRVRSADPRHRLRLPPDPARRCSSGSRSCTRPA